MGAQKIKEFVALKQAAKESGRSSRTLRRWAQIGKIQGYKIGTNWVFEREYFEEWKAKNIILVEV